MLFAAKQRLAMIIMLALLVLVVAPGGIKAESGGKLVAHYKFEGNFDDSSGSGYHSSPIGSVVVINDQQRGQCAQFNGGYLQVASRSDLDLAGKFTIAAWIKTDAGSRSPIISKMADNGSDSTYFASADDYDSDASLNDSTLRFWRAFGAGGTGYAEAEAVAGQLDVVNHWSRVVFTNDGSALNIYVDGVLKSTADLPEGSPPTPSKNYLLIGREVQSGDSWSFRGLMDDLRIYDYALSESDIKSLDAGASIASSTSQQIILQIGNPIMSVGGKQQELDPGRGTAPIIIDGSTMVPIKAIAEAMGGSVSWSGEERSISIMMGSKQVKLFLDNTTAYSGTQRVTLTVPPQVYNERTMVPLRFVGEQLNSLVEWDGSSRTIKIISNANEQSDLGIKNDQTVINNTAINPIRVHDLIEKAHLQFVEITREKKLPATEAISKQKAALLSQPEVAGVEELEENNLLVKFDDGYELVMIQGEGYRGSSSVPVPDPQAPSSSPFARPLSEINIPGSVLYRIYHGPEASETINRDLNYQQVVTDQNLNDILSISPTRPFKSIIFDTTADDPAELDGLSGKLSTELNRIGYEPIQRINDLADLETAANIDDEGYGVVVISGHGAAVNNDTYLAVRPWYDSPPPLNSGYVGTRVSSAYNGATKRCQYTYLIGSQFASEYWTETFPGTIFIIDACQSATTEGINGLPTWALDHGADAWIGWSASVSFSEGDNSTLNLLKYLSMAWETIKGAVAKIEAADQGSNHPPQMVLLAPGGGDINLPYRIVDKNEADSDDARDFSGILMEKKQDELIIDVLFYDNPGFDEFTISFDWDANFRVDRLIRCRATSFDICSVGSDGRLTTIYTGNADIKGTCYSLTVPWSATFGSKIPGLYWVNDPVSKDQIPG